MAQLNITLDQDEVLRLLGDDSGNAFRALLQETLNAVMRAESAEQLHAAPYERSEQRTDSRNGTRNRPLTTRVGTVELTVPRHRNVPFKTLVFENYKRSEAALVATMAEMVVAGVSTAKVGRVMQEICGKSFSKQSVSEACAELDVAVEAFRSRPLGSYLFAMADATYLKARVDRRIVSRALMIAIGFTPEGTKEIIGVSLAEAETKATWTAFLQSLRGRGLGGLEMFTSDAHEGLVAALQEVFPDVPWQRCQAHFTRNIVDAAPKKWREGLRAELVELFNCPDIGRARERKAEIMADYAELAPDAMPILDSGFDAAMTVMLLPKAMRSPMRTSNYLERLNKEVKRRTKVVGVFPTESSALRLAGAFLMEENDRWAAKRQLYYKPAVRELEAKRPELLKVARMQRELAKAA